MTTLAIAPKSPFLSPRTPMEVEFNSQSLSQVFRETIKSPPPKRHTENENISPNRPPKVRKTIADFKRILVAEGELAAGRIANQYGPTILIDILDTEDAPLLDTFIECANNRTLHYSMLRVIASRPANAMEMVEILDGRNWVRDSRDVANILEALADNYTPAHWEIAAFCLNRFKDRFMAPSDINYLFQKIAAPQDGMPWPRRDFHEVLAKWLIETGHLPTPFNWAQAIQKCAEQYRKKMVEILWNVTKGNGLPFAKFPQEWRMIMLNYLKVGTPCEFAYIHLLPFFFSFQYNTDRFERENVDENIRYKVFEENPAWLLALQVAIAEKHHRTSYLLLSENFLGQIDDPKTLLAALRLILDYERYDLLTEFRSKKLSKLSTNDLQPLILETCAIRNTPVLRNFEQMIRSIIRQREVQQEEASRLPFPI
jgi:hypothetical protein